MNLFKVFKTDRIFLGFIYCPFNKAKVEMKSEIFPTLTEKWKIRQFPLADKNRVAKVYSISEFSLTKVLMWQPVSIEFDLVAFITNMNDGWQGLLRGYSEDYKRKVIRVSLSEPNINYPGNSFEVMTIDSTRLIHAFNDSDKWVFYEKGDILPFEDGINYKKRKISNRLNNFIIEDYLKKNGIDINQEDFWRSRGKGIEFSTKLGKG